MKYSKILPVCCLLFLETAGCAHRGPSPDDFRQSTLRAEALVHQYGKRHVNLEEDYLDYLSSRLAQGLAGTSKQFQPTITILESIEPLAFSPGANNVLLSRGLVAGMQTESELAFVIAHEMAHQVLGHTALAPERYDPISAADTRFVLEKAADQEAVGIIALAGYHPYSAISALMHAYSVASPGTDPHGYPDLAQRVELIQRAIVASGWKPPGTIDRRGFQRFRNSIISLNGQ
jgi:beta-barrel assembly-enhancing protease